MVFVVDASVTLSWYLAEGASVIADMALERLDDAGAVAPVVWWFEVRNALLMNERRKRIDATQTAEIISHLEGLPIRLDGTRRSEAVLALGRAHRLTAYDAAYLELARRLDAPLATLDRGPRAPPAYLSLAPREQERRCRCRSVARHGRPSG